MSKGPVEGDPLPPIPIHTLQIKDNHDTYRLGHSASYTSLPGMVESTQGIKRTFSDNVLNTLAQRPAAQRPAKISSSVQNANIELFRRASSKTKKRMSAARFVSANEIEESERATRPLDKPGTPSTKAQGRSTGALKMFSRKTWLPTSRQTSPSRSEEPGVNHKRSSSSNAQAKAEVNSIAMPQPVATRVPPRSPQISDETPSPVVKDSAVPRKNSSSPAPPSHTTSENSVELESEASSKRLSRRSSFSSLRSRASIDRMYLSVPPTKVPPLPSSISSDRVSDRSSENGRQRDPHWIPFRSIDGEYASFQSKTSLQKAKVVRTVLLPLLSKTLDRAAVHSLRAEDLDRRIAILNKWWIGLLELLHGSGQQSISGTDRPAFLEAICEIMFRPEWKTPPYNSSPTEMSDLQQSTTKADSHSSIDSDEPDFLVRTIHQNIRNMFVQNIIQQMTFVIDKLSMRAAPASLVIFGGKTCAYAFFFCPGVADMLTRLWHIPPGTLRRIFAEYGPTSGRKAGIISRALASSFPPALRSLCFHSYAALSRQLQNKAQIPPNTAHIRWHGPWINRWIGRDSDLFFVFVKHYHLLVAEHLPRHLLPEERMGVPGFVVVHAQVLMNLESALYRQAGNFAAEHYNPASGDNPDAMAPLPMVIPNATRSIGENRLIMLLRDVIGERRPGNAALAEVLVGSFQYILKAAVRKVSMYNNDACFVLCDFLEELIPLVTKYQQLHVEDEDWEFWLKVYQQLMQSQATMTQIRVIAFLYGTWTILTTNYEKKRQLVLDWLLEPQFFAQYFNHWSPMVRHYFYRLLCWRVARSDGTASEVDIEIYQRLSQLLNKSWAHHQYLAADAEMRNRAPPSTNPCSPAPGRMLLIIRTDAHNRGTSFTSFDKLMPQGANQSSPYTSHSSMLSKVPEADAQQTTTKKRWSILRSIGLFNGPANNRPGEVTPPGSPDTSNVEGANNRQPGSNKEQQAISRPSSPPPRPLNFRFSLEYSNSRPQLPVKGRKLPLPSLPHTSQKVLDDINRFEGMSSQEILAIKEIRPLKPRPEELSTARYSGRALSEWAQVVHECKNFYMRRKQEGCRSDIAVETPCIAVESFRMFG